MFAKILSVFLSFIFTIYTALVGITPFRDGLRLVVPEDWELSVGDSRTVDYLFEDDIENRVLSWSVSPSNVATVDKWGRVTAVGIGEATVTAVTKDGLKDSVTLNVVETPTLSDAAKTKVDYKGEAEESPENYVKNVTKYANNAKGFPSFFVGITDYSEYQSCVTADGAKWEITAYGVLRTDKNAPTSRDVKQRFMGDRYFYSKDTSSPNVLAIYPDGGNGIWTLMKDGATHIDLVLVDGDDKAVEMSNTTMKNMNRHGLVFEAYQVGANSWKSYESDNDGLWTSMYGGGELMRYAVTRDDPNATPEEIAAAKKSAYLEAEAVLMLSYISMRTGTVDAYVRLFENGAVSGNNNDHRLSAKALVLGGDYSQYIPGQSPAAQFSTAKDKMTITGSTDLVTSDTLLAPFSPESWSNPLLAENANVQYEKRTRNLEGFVSRTYSLKSEGSSTWGDIFWSVNGDGTATGVSSITEGDTDYYLNGENLRGVTVDASGEIPARLWNDILGAGVSVQDIIYKGDTSADELAGHMFIFKLIYDILGDEDPEIKAILVNAIDNIAQHFADNGYQLLDGSGQPTTWGKFDRTTFLNSSGLSVAPLHAEMLLCIFKTAAYITGYQKWENEYRMAALDPAYEYAEVMTQYYDRYVATGATFIEDTLGSASGPLLEVLDTTDLGETLFRMLLNDSAEEMAMLGFYVLFQTETDNELINTYREALNSWWISMQYSENPLWYYIYQLAYPNSEKTDANGNSLIETAAWSLSRTPMDLRQWCASNENRDDIAVLDVSALGIKGANNLSYSVKDGKLEFPDTEDTLEIVKFALKAAKLDWAVAAPDERSVHKYNNNSYDLADHYSPYCMEASTIYTLPYWMARYHGMLEE